MARRPTKQLENDSFFVMAGLRPGHPRFLIGAASDSYSEAELLADPDTQRRLGARLRVDADGRLLGDDPRAVAGLPGDGAGYLDGDGRVHRRYRGGHRVNHQDIFRRAFRLARQAQASWGHGLWGGRFYPAGI